MQLFPIGAVELPALFQESPDDDKYMRTMKSIFAIQRRRYCGENCDGEERALLDAYGAPSMDSIFVRLLHVKPSTWNRKISVTDQEVVMFMS